MARSELLLGRSVCAAGQPVRIQASWCVRLSESDRDSPALTGRPGTALMVPAGALAGWEITQHPDAWPAYQQRVGPVLDAAAQAMFRLWQYSHCGAHHERDQRLSSGRWPSGGI